MAQPQGKYGIIAPMGVRNEHRQYGESSGRLVRCVMKPLPALRMCVAGMVYIAISRSFPAICEAFKDTVMVA